MSKSLFYWLSGSILFILAVIAIIGPRTLFVDVSEYHCYASLFWTGHLQNNHLEQQYCRLDITHLQLHKYSLPQEYPFLSLVIFSLPLLSPLGYSLSFRLLMLFFLLTIWWYFYKTKQFTSGIILLLFITLGLSSVAFNRYDLVASSLTFFALILASKKKFWLSYILLALSTFLKIYPLFFIPLVFILEWHSFKSSRLQLKKYYPLLSGLVVLTILFLISFNINGPQTLSPLAYQVVRPLQIESTPASIFLLFSAGKVCLNQSFGSINLMSVTNGQCLPNLLSKNLEFFFSGLMFISIITVYISWFKRKVIFWQACILLLISLIVFNKVLSPQYFLWLVPFLALNRKGFSLNIFVWLLLLGLSYIIYPVLYSSPQFPLSYIFSVILIRNILLFSLYVYTWKEAVSTHNSK